MAEATTLARPYAQAVFELAQASGKLPAWSRALSTLAAIANEDQIKKLIANPNIDETQLIDLILSIAKDKLDKENQNFVRTLAENGRLNLITEISNSYEAFKAEAEKTVKAEVISAFKLNGEQTSKLETALKKRLGCEVKITSSVDTSLVGGAIIRAGDLVIDGSVSGQLERLASELSH